jgi:tRNA A-37 threonylcarbamoyl transferase component Bud32
VLGNFDMELKRILSRLDGLFLGVVEDDTYGKTLKSAVQLVCLPNVKKLIFDNPTLFNPHYQGMARPDSYGIIQVIFTCNDIYGKDVRTIKLIHAIEIIDHLLSKAQRVIFGCRIDGLDQNFALKCMTTKMDKVSPDGIVTSIESEVNGFHIDDRIKHLFATKFAHGRLWLDRDESCEVILMEKLSKNNLFNQLVNEPNEQKQLAYLSSAFNLLHALHGLGYAHCDCHTGNILGVDDSFRSMKFIDPDRIERFGPSTDYRRNLLLMYDLYLLLIYSNPFILKKMNKSMSYTVQNMSTIHQRLKQIKVRAPHFSLDEYILFDISLASNLSNRDVLNVSISKYSEEFRRLPNVDFDGFYRKLTDMANLELFLTYMARQILKTEINPLDFDHYDLHGWEPLQGTVQNVQYPPIQPIIHGNYPVMYQNPVDPRYTHPMYNIPPQQVDHGMKQLLLTYMGNPISIHDAQGNQYGYSKSSGAFKLYLKIGDVFHEQPIAHKQMFFFNGGALTQLKYRSSFDMYMHLVGGRYMQLSMFNSAFTIHQILDLDLPPFIFQS